MCNGSDREFNNMNLRIRYLYINCRFGKIIDVGFAVYCFECINDMRNNEQRRKIIENILNFGEYNEDYYYSNKIIKKHSHFNHSYLTLPLSLSIITFLKN